LREAHVGEVRRAGIHRLGPARPAQVPEERGVAVPLLEERGPVVGPRLLAERRTHVLELLDDRRRGRRRRHRPFQARAHLPEERELLLHDAVRHAVVSGGKQSGYRVRRPRYSARCQGIDGRRGARHWLADATAGGAADRAGVRGVRGTADSGNTPPPTGPPPGDCRRDGDPVDLVTGLFLVNTTDLFLPDVMPIEVTRTYRPGDTSSRPFGIGTTHPYAIFLWSARQYQEVDLILPDGGRVHYVRTSPGVGFADAVFEHTATPSKFYKSTIRWNGNGWDLSLKDGTVFVFGENAPLQAIRDRLGNQITLTRAGGGQGGNITLI